MEGSPVGHSSKSTIKGQSSNAAEGARGSVSRRDQDLIDSEQMRRLGERPGFDCMQIGN